MTRAAFGTGAIWPAAAAPPADAPERARPRDVNRLLYWAARALVQPVFTIWFRLQSYGRERIPQSGPLILAANHRSVLDPIVVGLLLRRPVYYMAKKELFRKRWHAWLLSALGGFPIDRGGGDHDAMDVARQILERGDCVVIFPEGRCMPSGPLGRPRRGVGRLAQATGASVVPIAITGTEAANTQRIRPRRIRVRVGRALGFAKTDRPIAPEEAGLATALIWAAVTAEWEALFAAPSLPASAGRNYAVARSGDRPCPPVGPLLRPRATAPGPQPGGRTRRQPAGW